METEVLELIDESKVRFNDAPWAKQSKKILVLGAGGIGSWVSLALSRIGHELFIYDFDEYELVNMAGQFVQQGNIGKNKAKALCETLSQFNENGRMLPFDEKYDDEGLELPIVFSCFDNMASRKLAFEKWVALENKVLFIDGRLTAESYQVFAVTPSSIDRYRATLFSDEEGVDLPCSYKSTTHTSMIIAGEMVNLLNQHTAFGYVPFSIDHSLIVFNRNVIE